MTLPLPRYVIAKPLASGATGFYFTVPTRYRKMGCTIPNEPLGGDYAVACGVDGKGGRAAALNGLFDEWWRAKNANRWKTSFGLARSIGYFENTRQAPAISKESLSGAGQTTSARCYCLPMSAQNLATASVRAPLNRSLHLARTNYTTW